MKKLTDQQKHFFIIRSIYQKKRSTPRWRKRKKHSIHAMRDELVRKINEEKAPYIDFPAPQDFSFINNTNEVLEYFDKAKTLFNEKNKLIFNISDIENLTPDAIALLVASINDKDFNHKMAYAGTAPKKSELKELFDQSGFYNFVKTRGFKISEEGNILHKEKHYKVVPDIAEKAAELGIKHVMNNDDKFSPLYEILIECMSNTNNHASRYDDDKCNWWIFVHNNQKEPTTSYSFLDLGVGIFESKIVKNYLKTAVRKITSNSQLVDDLLTGNLQSRSELDNEIRGKGIPQIVNYSKMTAFKRFIIITNDMKIDVKNNKYQSLKHNFRGTFLYWELQRY